MKTVVIYKSKTGFAKKYALWIAQTLSADLFEASSVNADLFNCYDTVIYGAGLYAGGINGLSYITGNLAKLKNKKVVAFATGISPYRQETVSEVRNKNFTAEEQKHIHFFYLRGGFDYNKLRFFDKALMRLLKYKLGLKRKEELTDDERGMLASYAEPLDFAKKENINELINYVIL